MANVSKIKLGGTTYDVKDAWARSEISSIGTQLGNIASGMIFKGLVSASTGITNVTNYKAGWTYKATADFTLANCGTVESGDMIIAVVDGTSYNGANWAIVQGDIDSFTGASTAAAGTQGLVPQPQKGDQAKFLRGDGTWATAGSDTTWGSFSDLVH